MKLVDINTQRAEQAFAEKAAAAFAREPKMRSYTDGDIVPGCLFALRWGLHERAVAVLRLDGEHLPTIYGDLVPRPEVVDAEFHDPVVDVAPIYVIVCENDKPSEFSGKVDDDGPIVWEQYVRQGTSLAAVRAHAARLSPKHGACRVARLVFEGQPGFAS